MWNDVEYSIALEQELCTLLQSLRNTGSVAACGHLQRLQMQCSRRGSSSYR